MAMDAYFNLGMCFLQGFDWLCNKNRRVLLNFSIDGTPLKAGNSLEAATLMFNSLRQLSYEHKNVHRESRPLLALQNVQSDAAELSRNRVFESAIELQKRIETGLVKWNIVGLLERYNMPSKNTMMPKCILRDRSK